MRALIAAVLVLFAGCSGSREAERASLEPPAAETEAVAAPALPEPPSPAPAEAPPPAPAPATPGPLGCEAAGRWPTGQAPIVRLRQELQRLSQQQWETARRTAAQALCTLAVGLEGVPAPRASSSLTNEVRRQSRLLADQEQAPFTQSDRVRTGLEAAVAALEELAASHDVAAAGPWLRSARASLALVDGDDLFELQRPAIQDAFRTVSAAFAFVTGARASPADEPGSPQVIASPTVTRSGTLTAIEERLNARGQAFIYLRVHTREGPVLVEVAPAWFVERTPIPARPGDPVEFSGLAATGGATTSMVAFWVKGPRGGQLQVRDLQGRKLWGGAR